MLFVFNVWLSFVKKKRIKFTYISFTAKVIVVVVDIIVIVVVFVTVVVVVLRKELSASRTKAT